MWISIVYALREGFAESHLSMKIMMDRIYKGVRINVKSTVLHKYA
jgi:hypothetical protein